MMRDGSVTGLSGYIQPLSASGYLKITVWVNSTLCEGVTYHNNAETGMIQFQETTDYGDCPFVANDVITVYINEGSTSSYTFRNPEGLIEIAYKN